MWVKVKDKGERPKRTCNEQVEEESMKVGQSTQYALCRSLWVVVVYHIATMLR